MKLTLLIKKLMVDHPSVLKMKNNFQEIPARSKNKSFLETPGDEYIHNLFVTS